MWLCNYPGDQLHHTLQDGPPEAEDNVRIVREGVLQHKPTHEGGAQVTEVWDDSEA